MKNNKYLQVYQDSKFAESNQYQRMIENFTSFYQNQLNQITIEIDLKQLQINNSEYKSQTTPSTISTSLLLNKWENIHTEKEEMTQDKSINCLSTDDCLCCNRIKFIQTLFNDLLINKYLQQSIKDKNKDSEFLNIFLTILLSQRYQYHLHHILDDFHHIQRYHLKNKEDYEQFINCSIDIENE